MRVVHDPHLVATVMAAGAVLLAVALLGTEGGTVPSALYAATPVLLLAAAAGLACWLTDPGSRWLTTVSAGLWTVGMWSRVVVVVSAWVDRPGHVRPWAQILVAAIWWTLGYLGAVVWARVLLPWSVTQRGRRHG